MLELLTKAVRRTCTEEGQHASVDHLCAGRIVRVKVPCGLFSMMRLPYCEFHARWVKGQA